MKNRRRRFVVAIVAIALGAVVSVVTYGAMVVSLHAIMDAGTGVTVPAELDLDLEPGEEYVVWREMIGTHITVNRPLEEPPEDLEIRIIDRETGRPVETRPMNWRVTQSVFGFGRHRRSLVAFDPPEHGRISLRVSGSFGADQVYRIAPSISHWYGLVRPLSQIGYGSGALLMLVGVAMLLSLALKEPVELPS